METDEAYIEAAESFNEALSFQFKQHPNLVEPRSITTLQELKFMTTDQQKGILSRRIGSGTIESPETPYKATFFFTSHTDDVWIEYFPREIRVHREGCLDENDNPKIATRLAQPYSPITMRFRSCVEPGKERNIVIATEHVYNVIRTIMDAEYPLNQS